MRRLKRVIKKFFPKKDKEVIVYPIPQGTPVEWPVTTPEYAPVEVPQKEKTNAQ